jgi:hypothetical protein
MLRISATVLANESIQELAKLGGIESTVKLLDSNNSVVAENAALVLANSTHSSDVVCKDLIKSKGSLQDLICHIRGTHSSNQGSWTRLCLPISLFLEMRVFIPSLYD